jgi:hypothetical protein
MIELLWRYTVNRSNATSELVHVTKVRCQQRVVVIFFINFVTSTPNIEVRRMLCHVDFINISRKRKVVINYNCVQNEVPVSEFSIQKDRFVMKQIIFSDCLCILY